MMKSSSPLRVLTYHRVDSYCGDPLRGRPELTVTPAQFDFQMRTLSNHFTVVSLDRVLQAASGRCTLPARAVLITFDDAYSNIGTVAWPIMRELKLPATIFVATGFPDLSNRLFWWDRLRAAFSETSEKILQVPQLGQFDMKNRNNRLLAFKAVRNVIKDSSPQKADALLEDTCQRLGEPAMVNESMNWDEIRKLASEGVQFAPHSRSHPILTELNEEALEEELSAPLRDLENRLGSVPPVLAYPSGCYNQKVMAMAQSLGYKLGFTTELRNDHLHKQNNMALGRISLSMKYSNPAFRMVLGPGGIELAKSYKYLKQILKR